MTLPTVVAGQEILATDINNHINQTNTNTANIAANTNSINSINTTLAGYNNVPKDAALSSSGGVLACNGITLPVNSLRRISTFSGTGSGTFNHGLGVTPNIIIIQYAGNFGTPPSQVPAWYNANGSTVTVAAQGGYFWYGYAIGF